MNNLKTLCVAFLSLLLLTGWGFTKKTVSQQQQEILNMRQEVMTRFLDEGWQAGAQADAAAKYDGEGDAAALAIDVAPGVYLYQMTDAGLALQATIQGTKYWKDDELS